MGSDTGPRVTVSRILRGAARRILRPIPLDELSLRLVLRQAGGDPSLQPFLERYSLAHAREHFADMELTERHHQEVNRYFHARLAQILTSRLGVELKTLSVLEVGDSDGLLLRDLEKSGVGFNNSPKACAQIRGNGVAAACGDGQALPFPDKSFDVAVCFETLEHAPAPYLMLQELSRVARRKVYISIPGVKETVVHPRIKGERFGEWHVIEFCERDFRAFLTHTSLRVSHYEPIRIFAPPWGIRERLSYWVHSTHHLLAGSFFKVFQFYELEPTGEDLGVDGSAYWTPYVR